MIKRICLVIPNFQPGGMERVMSELSHFFCERGLYEVHLVLYGMKTEIFYRIPSNLLVHHAEFKFNKKFRILSTIRTLFFLRAKVKSINPYCVLSFGELWNSFVLTALYGTKYKVYVSDRSQPGKKWGLFHEWLRRKLYPKAAGIIYQTDTALRIYNSFLEHKNSIVIGNPIKQISCPENCVRDKVLLSIGRLINTKHHDELIKIFASIYNPEWKLIIVGADAQMQNNMINLEGLIDFFNMRDRIILAGKRSDIERFYCSSSIFAFTSSSEGFPNVIGEAMSAGLPIIAYDCVAGPSDMIKDGESGYLIKLHDMEDFKKKLETLMNDSTLRERMGKIGKKNIEEFSLSKIGKKFEDFLLA